MNSAVGDLLLFDNSDTSGSGVPGTDFICKRRRDN